MLFCLFCCIVHNLFVHNVAATVSYDPKELLDIRTVITHLRLDKFFFNESDGREILQTPDQAQLSLEKETEISRKRSGCLVKIRQGLANLPLPSVLLANVQSLGKKWDELKARISYQRDIKNCNILCFTKSWLNDDIKNIQLADYTLSAGQNSNVTKFVFL